MSVLHPVTVKHQVSDWAKAKYIRLSQAPVGYELYVDGVVVASCGSPKALSEWALDKGAKEVRWDFDLATVARRDPAHG